MAAAKLVAGEVAASLLLQATPATERYGGRRVASRRDGGDEARLLAVATSLEKPAGDHTFVLWLA
nr:hypothetical protein Iba_chr14bCG8850 [Ipomoea batatas]GMD92051.1 hypothetical protein Iba_chr14eCG5380 [Ipomoea batatas]